MARRNRELVAATLRLAHTAGVHRVFGGEAAGRGVILMLHKVGRHEPGAMAYPPHEDMIITPEFLRALIDRVRALGYDIVSMDEAVVRLREGAGRRFVVLTFDDAYRDTLEVAYPVLRAAEAPFAVYVPTSWVDGRGLVKWAVLEALVSSGVPVAPRIESLPAGLLTATGQQKEDAIAVLDNHLSGLGAFAWMPVLRDLAYRHGIDTDAICRDQIMTWDEIRHLAGDDLVTIGAHSVDHVDLSELTGDDLDHQLRGSRDRVEAETGRPCRHFAYPFGDAETAGSDEVARVAQVGFVTAVTTRRGVVFDIHRDHLTALPRIALSGRMEDLRCMEMLISGVPDMVLNRFRKRVA